MAIADTYRPGYDRERRSTGERRHASERGAGATLRALGVALLHVALAMVFLWSGALAFTTYGAQSLALHAMHSPLLSWAHALLGVHTASVLFGAWQVAAGVFILARVVAPLFGAIGAAMAAFASLLTLSFLFTTPGAVAAEAGGFPALSVEIGIFLLKDLVLLGASLWVLGDCMARRR